MFEYTLYNIYTLSPLRTQVSFLFNIIAPFTIKSTLKYTLVLTFEVLKLNDLVDIPILGFRLLSFCHPFAIMSQKV